MRLRADVRRHFWVLLLLAGLGAVIGWITLRRTEPQFEAVAVLEVSPSSLNILNVEGLEDRSVTDSTGINTLVQAIQSRSVLARAVKTLSLASRPDFAGKAAPGSEAAASAAIQTLRRHIDASIRSGTRLVDVSVRHANPQLAAELANTVAMSLGSELASQRAAMHDLANSSLVEEAKRLRGKLRNSELALQAYKADHDAVSLDERKVLLLTQLRSINTQLSDVSAKRLRLRVDLEACSRTGVTTDDLLSIPGVTSHPKVSDLLTEIQAKTADLTVLSEQYLPKHPKYLDLQAELDTLRSQLDAVITHAVALLNSNYKSACDLEESLQVQLKEQEKKALEIEGATVQYNVLKRDLETDEAIYQSVLSRLKEVDLIKGVQMPSVHLQQAATVPQQPVLPVPSKHIAFFASGGGMCGFALIYLLALWDSSFRTVEDAERRLGLPVLAALGTEKPAAASGSPLAMDCVRQPDGRIAEAFRTLRAMVSLLGQQQQRRVVMFASALPSEGKTFCASNYAISLAQQGLRTLLIDADLRRPSVAAIHFRDETRPGITDLILGTVRSAEAIHASSVPNLAILPAGCSVPNPAELLASIDIHRWLAGLLDFGFERIVIDSAPLLPVSDSYLIVPHVDTVLLVIKARSTSFKPVERVIGRLHESQKPPSGLVLNCLKPSAFGREDSGYYRSYASAKKDSKP